MRRFLTLDFRDIAITALFLNGVLVHGSTSYSAVVMVTMTAPAPDCTFLDDNEPFQAQTSGGCFGQVSGEFNASGAGAAFATTNLLEASANAGIALESNFPSDGPHIETTSIALWNDVIRLSPNATAPEFVSVTAEMHGSGRFGELTLAAGSSPTCDAFIDTSGSVTCNQVVEINAGGSATFQMDLLADVNFTLNGTDGDQVSGIADFSHTASVISVQAFDLNMQPVSTDGITFDSGFDFADLPEPRTLYLVGAGLVTAVTRRCAADVRKGLLARS